MSLREQLREILPQILPANPSEAIKGTDLIRFVRLRLGDEYSDATLRYHFSILSYDPSSPIAKVDQGQGYYLRIEKPGARDGTYKQGDLYGDTENTDENRARLSRFRTIVERHTRENDRFPFMLSEQNGGDWELPDLVFTDWDFEMDAHEVPRLDAALINLKKSLGVASVTLTAAQLKLNTTLDTVNADFFQAVSTTRWANHGEIIIAEPVTDEALLATLRALGQQYGVGIISFGIELTLLDELPSAEAIQVFTHSEFESLQTLLKIQRISAATHRPHVDWPHLVTLRQKHAGIVKMIAWLNECLDKGQPS